LHIAKLLSWLRPWFSAGKEGVAKHLSYQTVWWVEYQFYSVCKRRGTARLQYVLTFSKEKGNILYCLNYTILIQSVHTYYSGYICVKPHTCLILSLLRNMWGRREIRLTISTLPVIACTQRRHSSPASTLRSHSVIIAFMTNIGIKVYLSKQFVILFNSG